ncbi:MAG: PKD domain-containing protein [Muribaculaceae bacterium]|nr:PKD domain-containing protein [Muribaculaceae bacterium]
MNPTRLLTLISAALIMSACDNTHSHGEPEPDNTPGNNQAAYGTVTVTVLEYNPAPGQFINELPPYTDGDDAAAMATAAQKRLNDRNIISLGALGGNITLRLERPIANIPGTPNLRVCGNAYLSGTMPDGTPYGSAEPGIVEVMEDSNGNGIPDDGPWFMLRGSEYERMQKVTVSYLRPDSHQGDIFYTLTGEDGTTETGVLPHQNTYHEQPYYPLWLSENELTFTTWMLPPNGIYDTESGLYRLLAPEGYADSYPNNDIRSALYISDAVDSQGIKVNLKKINFIRVTTAVLQHNGALGECSTEISGIECLNR